MHLHSPLACTGEAGSRLRLWHWPNRVAGRLARLIHPSALSTADTHGVAQRRRIAISLREIQERNHTRLYAALALRDVMRLRVADAYAFEDLARQHLLGDSSWEVHFKSRSALASPLPQRATPRKVPGAGPSRRRSVTPQSTHSALYFRSLSSHQEAVERAVIHPPARSSSSPAHMQASRNILRRAGVTPELGPPQRSGGFSPLPPPRTVARGLFLAPPITPIFGDSEAIEQTERTTCDLASDEGDTGRSVEGTPAETRGVTRRKATTRASAARERESSAAGTLGVDIEMVESGGKRGGEEGEVSVPFSAESATQDMRAMHVAHARAKRPLEGSVRAPPSRRSRRCETLYGTGDGPQYAD